MLVFSKMIPIAFIVVILVLARNGADATIGINWGRENAQKLLPSNVVDLILQNGIQRVRLFTSEEALLQAFAGSGIELTISINNVGVIESYEKANDWIQMRQKYFDISKIRSIYFADNTFAFFDKASINKSINSLQCLQQALNDAEYGDRVKVTIPQANVIKFNKTSLRPSEAEFREEIRPQMAAFVNILKQNGSPFVIALSPIIFINDLQIDVDFALLENTSSLVVKDENGAAYTNIFEIMFDSYAWALKKINASDVKIIVGQVGWPTDGYNAANATLAEVFYKNLLPWVSSNKGTPMRPGAPIDVYIHSLTDENRMPIYDTATFTRHFGIYRSNGKPKYKIDLSGQGRDIYPADATGIMRMPERWCIFNGDRSNIVKVMQQFDRACSQSDCTTLAPGASCSKLDFNQNISYAFNMHFQFQYQNETECDFDGLGQVSLQNPSTPGCVFPIEVVKARLPPYSIYSTGFRDRPNNAIFVFLLSIIGTLFWNL